jgi:hypothetical protein
MSGTYICYHTCYYGPRGLRKLYSPGDKLLPGIEPGKYFSLDGAPPKDHVTPSYGPGDDPRSTYQIRADLLAWGVKMPSSSSRRSLYNKYLEEKSKHEDDLPQSVMEGQKQSDPLGGKNICEMTPDEISSINPEDVVVAIQMRYGAHLKYNGKNRDEVMKKAVQIEMEHAQ